MPESAPISSAAIDRDNPWPGLATFTEEQRAYFHGRDEEILDLTQLAERRPLVVLFGQSGLGKSSILQAGVFPRLRTDGFCPIYIRLDHAETAPAPSEQVKALVKIETTRVGTWTKPGAARPGETLWEFFHHRDDRLIDRDGLGVVPVLVFDQFEELFTLGAARGERRERAVAFIRELAELVENRPSAQLVARLEQSADEMDAFDFGRTDYRVILSLREDFLPDLESLKTIMPALMQKRLRLARMTGKQALEAVLKPGGALVTEDVARAIVEFVAGARGGSAERLAELDVEPALLSVICRELNERRRALGQAQITADLVSGNRREILTDFYERSVADLPEAMRSFVEDRLLTKSGFRDNLALESALEFPGVTRPLIDTLVNRRLVRTEDRLGVERVELTHDVLAEVIRGSRDARQHRIALEEARQREARALAAVAQQSRRQRWIIGGLAAAVAALCVGGAVGLRARRIAFQNSSRTDVAFASQLLEQGRTADGLAYLVRAAGKDPHNPVVAPRLASLLASHNFALPEGKPAKYPSRIFDLHYSPDGQRLAVVCEDGTVGFVGVADGTKSEIKIAAQISSALWFGERGSLRAADGAVRVVNIVTGKIEREFRFEKPIAGQIVRGRNNSALFVLADGDIRTADLLTGAARVAPFKFPSRNLNELRVCLDGRWAAVVPQKERVLRVYDLDAGKLQTEIPIPGEPKTFGFVRDGEAPVVVVAYVGDPTTIAFRLMSALDGRSLIEPRPVQNANVVQGVTLRASIDRRYFSLSSGAGLQIFDSAAGAPVGGFIRTPGTRQDLGFSLDSRYHFASGANGGIDVWDVAAGKVAFAGINHDTITRTGTPDATGRFVLTTSTSGIVRLWDLHTGRLVVEPTLQAKVDAVAALSPDGRRFAIGGFDGTVYRLQAGQNAARPIRLASGNFLPSSSTRLFQIEQRSRARILDAASLRESASFSFPEPIAPSENRRGFGFRGDGNLMVVRTEKNTKWQAWTLGPAGVTNVATLVDAPTGSGLVTFSPRGNLVAIIFNDDLRTVRIWNAQTGASVGQPIRLAAPTTTNGNLPGDFSPDGSRFAVGTNSGAIQVFEAATGRELFQIERLRPSSGARHVRYNPDGSSLYAGNTWGESRLWKAVSGEPLSPIMYHSDGITAAEFSRDGRLLVTASNDGTAQVWDGRTGAAIGERLPHKSRLRAVRFSDDGSRVLTASEDMTARVWDAATSQPLTEPLKHDSRVTNAWLSPDGSFAQTGAVTPWLWSLPPTNRGAVPDWLRELATICASKRVTDDGKVVDAEAPSERLDEIRRTLASLPDDAPYVEWGRWFLADRATRSIGPGFTITPAEAEELAKGMPTAP